MVTTERSKESLKDFNSDKLGHGEESDGFIGAEIAHYEREQRQSSSAGVQHQQYNSMKYSG